VLQGGTSCGLVVHTEAGQTWRVDIRVKTFVLEAADRLDFLRTEYGFAGPEVVPDETGLYPLLRRVRYKRSDLTLEISLVLSYMGEEYVFGEEDLWPAAKAPAPKAPAQPAGGAAVTVPRR
jgi:hypothetical protein